MPEVIEENVFPTAEDIELSGPAASAAGGASEVDTAIQNLAAAITAILPIDESDVTNLVTDLGALDTRLDAIEANDWVTSARIAANAVGASELADDAVDTNAIVNLAVTDGKVATANKDGASGTASMRTLGTGAAQACAGNDSRLSDTRTPTDGSVTTAKLADDNVTVEKCEQDLLLERWAWSGNGAINGTSGNQTRYLCPRGGAALSSVRANVQLKVRQDVVCKNLRIYVTGNNFLTNNVVVTLYDDGSSTALTKTITPGTTGELEDTTHSVSVAAGSLLDLQFDIGIDNLKLINFVVIEMEVYLAQA